MFAYQSEDGHLHLVPNEIIKVGRDHKAQIQTKGGSRMHAVIETNKNQPVLVDLGNEGGTKVNGNRVNKCKLNVGDVIEIEGEKFIVCEDADDAAKEIADKFEAETAEQFEEMTNKLKEAFKIDPGLKEKTKQMLDALGIPWLWPEKENPTEMRVFLDTLKENSNDPDSIVEAVDVTVRDLRGKISNAFEVELVRFVLDNKR
jgi:pSer/pThr/pTyr-binding forkhead associated (FHA) protein